MTKKKVISGAIMILIVVALFLLPIKFARVICAVAVGLLAESAYREILELKKSHNKIPPPIVALGFICTALMTFQSLNSSFIYGGISFMMILLITVILLIPTIFYKKEEYTSKDAFYLIGNIIFIGLFFNLVFQIFNKDKWLLLYLILVATMTDTFAMFIGLLIGKHKLIPSVSPNKSVEGSIAGSLLGTIISSIYFYNVVDNINIILLITISLILTILGQLGDLLFSKIKRENEIKDFSNIIPGHGGILDRFDSLSFIVFGYIIILNILNILK